MAYDSQTYYTQKIIKLTKSQYDALKNGESVKGYRLHPLDTLVLDIDSLYNDIPTKTSQLTNDSGFVTSSGVTSITLKSSGTGLSVNSTSAITSTGERTYTLDSSSAGNAAANKVVLRNAAGSIQTEKLAISSGTTTKSTIQYNTTEGCLEFVFE